MADTSHFYAFKKHRKAELIDQACHNHQLSRREANEMTLEQLSQIVNTPYVPLRLLPKPSHRRPLPVRKWIVPKEYKIFIVMNKPFETVYRGWEQQFAEMRSEEDEDEYYSKLEDQCDSCVKCPKMKWVKKFIQDHPKEKMILFLSPRKWNTVKGALENIPHSVVTNSNTRVGRKAIQRLQENEVNVLVVSSDDPPYDDLMDCTWIHFSPDTSHKRCASSHYYLNVIKPNEKHLVSDDNELTDLSQATEPLSLDLFKWMNDDE